MQNEHLNQKPKPEQQSSEEHNISANDLKFMRSTVEKTRRDFDPGAIGMIAWGLACLIGFSAMHFLAKPEHNKFIWPVVILVLVTAFVINVICDIRIRKREKKAGFISRLSRQINWIWAVAVLHGLVWSILGLFNDWYGGPGFLWALVYSIALCATGILHSKEWLWGGLGVFAGMIAAFLIKDYAYLILGFVMGAGCILPAIIAQRNYRKQEKENAQA